MSDDHDNAHLLGEGLSKIPGIAVDMDTVQTNMVFFTLAEPLVGKFSPFMAERGIIISDGPYPIRAVTHYGIEPADIEHVLKSVTACSARFLN